MVNRKGKRLVAYLLAFSMVLTVAGIQLAAQGQETEYITTWEEGFNVDDSGAWVTEHT